MHPRARAAHQERSSDARCGEAPAFLSMESRRAAPTPSHTTKGAVKGPRRAEGERTSKSPAVVVACAGMHAFHLISADVQQAKHPNGRGSEPA